MPGRRGYLAETVKVIRVLAGTGPQRGYKRYRLAKR
jgi:hypothetical protein